MKPGTPFRHGVLHYRWSQSLSDRKVCEVTFARHSRSRRTVNDITSGPGTKLFECRTPLGPLMLGYRCPTFSPSLVVIFAVVEVLNTMACLNDRSVPASWSDSRRS